MAGVDLLADDPEGIDLLAGQTNPVNLLQDKPQQNPMANTFMGQLPRNMPEFNLGSPENKELMQNLLAAGAGGPSMNVIGGGVGSIAKGAGTALVTKVPAFLRGLTNNSTVDSLVKAVQKPHDILSNTAEQLYDYVKNTINSRGLKLPVKQQYLDQAKLVLPKTRASEQLINKAKTGDYDAVHDLQSHLYDKGTKGLTSDDLALNNQGEEILDLRNSINEDTHNTLVQSGHTDIAHVLKQGRNVYSKLMDTYYGKNLPKSIGKLVHRDLRLVPENPAKIFEQDSVPMKKFLAQHPDVAKEVQGVMEKQAAKKALGKIFMKTGATGGAVYGAKTLFDLLK